MEWEKASTDALEQQLIANEQIRSRLAASDIEILAELDRRQVATADGCRNLSEWLSSRVDVSLDTARERVRTMRRTVDRPRIRRALAEGVSFDRVAAVSRIKGDAGLLEHLDIAGVRRHAARQAEIDSDAESKSVDDQYLVIEPSLDESWWKLWGGLDGASGAIVDKALSEKADLLPEEARRGSSSWRRAMALVETCISDEPIPAQVTVFVDAQDAAASSGGSGVTLEAGPRVGIQALEAILCDAVTEVTALAEDGVPMAYGRRSRTIPPRLRRAIVHRDGGACSADGCNSRSRLQVHHSIPRSEFGATDPDNLITLCWFHHQVVVHRWGYQIYGHPAHGRIRFRPPRGPPRST